MMRHQVKCPGRGDNADCKTLHDLGNLQELRRHIENEQFVKKSNDSGHLSVQLDRLATSNGFRNAEMDLKHVYSYKKVYYYDLESGVRTYLFKQLTAQVKPVKSVKRKEKREFLDYKTGKFYYSAE